MSNVKIVTFVPIENADDMRDALGRSGSGSLGNYKYTSYSHRVVSRFMPENSAEPHIGEPNQPEQVEEERIEVICERHKARDVIKELRSTHPYEEPAFDIIPLLDEEEL